MPELPFFYYHIPGITRTEISILELLETAEAAGFEQLASRGGVKFVWDDYSDFLSSANWVAEGNAAGTRNPTILFAPEPKLQGFALQTPYAGAVLAEDFYAPTYIRMRSAYDAGDAAAAIAEQNWKQSLAEPIFSK